MAIEATITVIYQAVGAVGGTDSITNSMVSPDNTNAPPPGAATLQGGANNVILIPNGFTVTSAYLRPPVTSTNSKTVKGVSSDTGLPGWTNQPIVVPVTANGQIVIFSTSLETIEINWG